MRINTNIMAFNAFRNLDSTNNRLAKSLEKLSSGYRINRAADDASGLVISQNLDIEGPGPNRLKISGNGASRVFVIAGGSVTIAGVTIRLRDASGSLLATTTTNASGLYSFTNLIPGDYNIQFTLPGGYRFTQQNQGGNEQPSAQPGPALRVQPSQQHIG